MKVKDLPKGTEFKANGNEGYRIGYFCQSCKHASSVEDPDVALEFGSCNMTSARCTKCGSENISEIYSDDAPWR